MHSTTTCTNRNHNEATVVAGDKRLLGLPASAPLCFVVEKLTCSTHPVVWP